MIRMLQRIGLDTFVMSIGLCILAAYIWPEVGMDRQPVSLGDVAAWGVSVIFFFYGLRLSPELKNYRLHLLVHFSTFVMFPLLVLAVMRFVSVAPESTRYYVMLGIFFLAALPSTVSSSVVMVSMAGGNIPAAIFNASVSSLMGIFLTPLWMSIYVNAQTGGYPVGEIFVKLVLQVLVPVCIGLALNRRFGKFAESRGRTLKIFDQAVILLIIYTSFCQSFHDRMFDGFSARGLLLLVAAMVVLFFAAYGVIYVACRAMNFNREDTITALFCGSKKSLVHGSVMSKVIFANPAIAGVVLLPTMIYHAAQLVIVSAIAKKISIK